MINQTDGLHAPLSLQLQIGHAIDELTAHYPTTVLSDILCCSYYHKGGVYIYIHT